MIVDRFSDVRTGLGPVEYAIKQAVPGDYVIGAQYQDSSWTWNRTNGVAQEPTTLKITVYTNYARATQVHHSSFPSLLIVQTQTSTLVRFSASEFGVVQKINVPAPAAVPKK